MKTFRCEACGQKMTALGSGGWHASCKKRTIGKPPPVYVEVKEDEA